MLTWKLVVRVTISCSSVCTHFCTSGTFLFSLSAAGKGEEKEGEARGERRGVGRRRRRKEGRRERWEEKGGEEGEVGGGLHVSIPSGNYRRAV